MDAPAFEIVQGEKFGAVVLDLVWRREDLAHPVYLGDDLWILPQTPFEIQQHWREWLGSIRAGGIRTANLWLVAKVPTKQPDVINEENTTAIERATRILYALLIAGPIAYEQGFFLSGGNVSGEPEVRQFGDLDRFRVTEGTSDASVGLSEVNLVRTILDAFKVVFDEGPFGRVCAGIIAFLRGLQREHIDARLHQFVRSLEGVIKPTIGKTRKQFVHRGQTFTGTSAANAKILSESFDIRSQVEHLHDWRNALPDLAPHVQEDRLKSHQRRIEALCRHVYGRICTSLSHRALFDDGAIDEFWRRPADEKRTLWGSPRDLASLT